MADRIESAGSIAVPAPEAPAPPDRRRAYLLLAILAATAGAAISLETIPFQLDDAYIAYRYAANLAAGHGFAFNAGGPEVEGFSSPLWVLGLAAASAIGGPDAIPWAAVGAGFASFLATLLILRAAARRPLLAERAGDGPAGSERRVREAAARAALVSVACFSLLPTADSYAVSGLETLLFAAAVAASAACVAGGLPAAAGLVAGGSAIWIPPEGAWIPIAAARQAAAVKDPGMLRRRRVVLPLLGVAGGALALLAFRVAIFGALLPNTWHAKRADVVEGLRYAWETLAMPPFQGLLACAILGARAGGGVFRGYLAAGAAWVAAAILEGGDWMSAGRMLLPAFALFAMAAAGIGAAPRRGCPGSRRPSCWPPSPRKGPPRGAPARTPGSPTRPGAGSRRSSRTGSGGAGRARSLWWTSARSACGRAWRSSTSPG